MKVNNILFGKIVNIVIAVCLVSLFIVVTSYVKALNNKYDKRNKVIIASIEKENKKFKRMSKFVEDNSKKYTSLKSNMYTIPELEKTLKKRLDNDLIKIPQKRYGYNIINYDLNQIKYHEKCVNKALIKIRPYAEHYLLNEIKGSNNVAKNLFRDYLLLKGKDGKTLLSIIPDSIKSHKDEIEFELIVKRGVSK